MRLTRTKTETTALVKATAPVTNDKPQETVGTLKALLPDRAFGGVVEGWRQGETVPRSAGAAMIGAVRGGATDLRELGNWLMTGWHQLAGETAPERVAKDLATALGGETRANSEFSLSRADDVLGTIAGRKVELEFPSGGVPWRTQGKRMRVRLDAAPGVSATVDKDDPQSSLQKAGLSKNEVAVFTFGASTLFDPAGSDLQIKNGKAEVELVLPDQPEDLGAAKLEAIVAQVADVLKMLEAHA